MSQINRRTFLTQAAAFSSVGAAVPLGINLSAITQAAAQSAGGGYRALVCIFLAGGNDAYNTVLATDTASWQHYRNQRDPSARNPQDTATGIALLAPGVQASASSSASPVAKLGGVLDIGRGSRAVHASRQFALHPSLKQAQQMYGSGKLAVLANVGPLTRPTSKADWADARMSKPAKLFSHNDQQSTWQSFKPEGANAGWGGRMGDMLTRSALSAATPGSDASIAIKSFTCMTPGNNSVWLASQNLQAYQSSNTAILQMGINSSIYGSAALHGAVTSIMGGAATSNKLASEYEKVVQRGVKVSSLLGSKLPALGVAPWSSAGVTNVWADDKLRYTSPLTGNRGMNDLALQLQMVARLMEANRNASTPLSRQLFMVTLGGFDTHDNQMVAHAERLAVLDHALAYFDNVLGAMPGGDMRSQVTTFTASEFGRSFTSNGDGTDHGWGSHHLIMGGAVHGSEVYGSFPEYSTADSAGVFASPNQIQNGTMLPSTSVDQYAYTLGKWMGVATTDMVNGGGTGILPNLGQFNSSLHDLGFMAA